MESSKDNMSKNALVFGASGITGWSVVNELLSTSDDAQCFDRVIALTVRRLDAEAALWPESSKLQVVDGVDLTRGSKNDLASILRDKVPSIGSVTHLFFNSYKWAQDPKVESLVNSSMLERAVMVIEELCPKFEYLVLPTGTKAYGMHLLENFPYGDRLPLTEDLPRLPEPHASEMFYYWETDTLDRLSQDKTWTWCEVRPDLVVGFVPNDNAHCLAQTLAIYLSLYREVNGKNSKVPWPGTAKSYKVLSSQTSQDMLAKFSVWASLHPQLTGNGEAFNVLDSNRPSTWEERWHTICSLFDLEGIGYVEGTPSAESFMMTHRAKWDELTETHGLKSGHIDNNVANPYFFKNMLTLFDYDHQASMEKAYKLGFQASWDDRRSWDIAFQRFRMAKIIP